MALTLPNTTIGFAEPVNSEPFMTQLFKNLFDGVTAGTALAGAVAIPDSSGNIQGLGIKYAAAVGIGSTKTLAAANLGLIAFDTATGSVATLPAASGSGLWYTFYVKTLATSNSHIVYTSSANGVGGTANNFIGLIQGTRTDSGNAPLSFAAAANSNTITLNRTTTGSVNVGEYFTVIDVAANTWLIKESQLSATGGAFATPFSHT